MKHKKASKKKSRGPKRDFGPREPNLNVRLSTIVNAHVTTSNSVVLTLTYHSFSGFGQLASFFQFAHPKNFKLDVQDAPTTGSTTPWSGIATFIPANWELDTTVPTSFVPAAIAETKECIEVQPGTPCRGRTCPFVFKNQSWNAQQLDGNGVALNSKVIGYAIFYNENPAIVNTWDVESVLYVNFRFFKRNVIQYGTLTEGSVKLKEYDSKEESKDESLEILNKD